MIDNLAKVIINMVKQGNEQYVADTLKENLSVWLEVNLVKELENSQHVVVEEEGMVAVVSTDYKKVARKLINNLKESKET